MKRGKYLHPLITIAALLVLFAADRGLAQPQSPNFMITQQAFSAAAVFDSTANYSLFSSVGQWTPADTHRSMNYFVTSGFLTPSYGSATGAFLVVNPPLLDFSEIHVDSVSTLTITLSDTGYWNLTVTGAALSQGTMFQFDPLPQWPDTVYARSTRNYSLQFHPTAAGLLRDTLTILHDAGDPVIVPLEGTGTAPGIAVVPDSLPYGDLWISSFTMDTFWVNNPGTADLHVTGITSNNPLFPSDTPPFTVPSGGSQSVPYVISLPETLSYSGILTVHSDAGNPTLWVTAHGIWTELRADPAAILLESVAVSDTVDTTITLLSVGNTFLTIDTVRLFTNQFAILQPPGDTISAYSSDDVRIRFTCETAGIYVDTLVIEHSAGNPLRIPLAAGATALEEAANLIPKDFFLDQNFPNPFNPATRIKFGLPKTAEVTIDVYDILGRQAAKLASGPMMPGVHTIVWDCASCPSGMYLIRMQTNDRVFIRKMLLMK